MTKVSGSPGNLCLSQPPRKHAAQTRCLPSGLTTQPAQGPAAESLLLPSPPSQASVELDLTVPLSFFLSLMCWQTQSLEREAEAHSLPSLPPPPLLEGFRRVEARHTWQGAQEWGGDRGGGASVQRQACRPAVSEEGCSGGTRIRSAFRTHHSAYGEKGGVKVLSRSPEEWPGAKAPIPEGGAGCWYERWTAQPGSRQLRSKSERRHYHPDILLWLTGGPGQRHWSGELLGCRCCAGSPQAHLRLKFQS